MRLMIIKNNLISRVEYFSSNVQLHGCRHRMYFKCFGSLGQNKVLIFSSEYNQAKE